MTQKTGLGASLLDELPSDSRHTRQLVRRQMIAEAVMTEGSMRIEDLTDRFGISLMTAHRDVDELVSRGLFPQDARHRHSRRNQPYRDRATSTVQIGRRPKRK